MTTSRIFTTMSTCTVEDSSHSSGRLRLGLCRKHYERKAKFGDPMGGVGVHHGMPLPQRFWSRVSKGSDCWLWTGPRGETGYGHLGVKSHGKGRTLMAHRLSYMLLVGPIPEGLTIDHLCRNRACVRPDHLEAVTSRENTLRSPIAPAAVNARKTHCKRGHPLSGSNLYVPPGRPNIRSCKECPRQREKALRQAMGAKCQLS